MDVVTEDVEMVGVTVEGGSSKKKEKKETERSWS